MAFIRNVSLNIKAGQKETLPLRGDGLRLVSANVPIFFREEGGDIDFYLEQGEQALFDKSIFKSLQVWHESVSDQTITLTQSEGSRFNGAKISGTVNVNNSALGSNTQKTVTNASGSMVNANATRKYLLIQNKDTSGNIYINFGAEATVANGLKIASGGSFELNSNILTAEIFAIGDIASNVNIVVVEG